MGPKECRKRGRCSLDPGAGSPRSAARGSGSSDEGKSAVNVTHKANADGSLSITIHDETIHCQVMKQITEDDPTLFLMWDYGNLASCVACLNGMHAAGSATPVWMNAAVPAFPITVDQLIQSIITRVGAHGGGITGTCIITPNTVHQHGKVVQAMLLLGLDPLFATMVIPAFFPLATNWVMMDRQVANRAERDALLVPPFGHQVLA